MDMNGLNISQFQTAAKGAPSLERADETLQSRTSKLSPSDQTAPPDLKALAALVVPAEARMMLGIDADVDRFRRIVKGRIRGDLKKYMSREDMIGKRNKDIVSIPIDSIEIPHFAHGAEEQQGVSQGDGEPGDTVSGPNSKKAGKAGEGEGQHVREERLSIQELAEMVGEELKLPRIQPKGKDTNEVIFTTWTDISRSGPDSLRHNKRSFREAMKRTVMSGDYDEDDPEIVITRADFRYKAPRVRPKPKMNAAIIYLMDVSGSMDGEHKEIARMLSFWIDLWLDANYKGCEKAYVIHDAAAKEVDRETFFTTTESGGTRISSGLEQVERIIKERFNPEEWNIYVVQFSDGDNLGREDNKRSLEIMQERILPFVNLYAYGQIEVGSSIGEFGDVLDQELSDREDLATARIRSRDDIPEAIRSFFAQGR